MDAREGPKLASSLELHELAARERFDVLACQVKPFDILAFRFKPFVPRGFNPERIIGLDRMSGVSSFWDLKCQFILSFAKRDCLLDCVVTPSLDPGENPAAGQPVSFFRCSTGDFPSRQASKPPSSGRTRWIPFFFRSIAVRALEISSGEVQWRISRSRGLSWCRYSTFSSEKLSAPGITSGSTRWRADAEPPRP